MSPTLRMTDAQHRAGVSRIGQSIALRSGAGCGKTFVLATRFTELLIQRLDDPDALGRLVALTFTDKAALEMRQRVADMLRQRAGDEPDPNRAKALRDQVDRLPEARIGTIHSFCSTVLRTWALEAGIDPAFAVAADNDLVEQLKAQAVEEAVLSAVESGDEPAARLITRLPMDRVTGLVGELLNLRDRAVLDDYLEPADTLDAWSRVLAGAAAQARQQFIADGDVDRLVAEASAGTCDDPQDKLHVRRGEVLGLVELLRTDPSAWTPEVLGTPPAKLGSIGRADAWGGKETVMEVRSALRRLVEILIDLSPCAQTLNELDRQAADDLAVLCRMAGQALLAFSAEKRRRGLLDFDDLLIETRRLLTDRLDVRRQLADGIDQLLIDECQDTSSIQVDLLVDRLLCEGDQAAAPPPGRLFVVGDEKQSIYRFRGAEVEVFTRLCDRLGEDAQEHLDLSFRTHAAGVGFINHLFGRLMGPGYRPIEAHRTGNPPQPSVEILLAETDSDRPTVDEIDLAQARLIGQRIEGMIQQREPLVWDRRQETFVPPSYRDIAILYQRMTHTAALERELAERGIPYYVVGGLGLFRQQEVFDLVNALRAIENPFDDVAFVGLLRGGMVGLDDNDLVRLARAYGPPYLPALSAGELPATISDSTARRLAFARDLVNDLHARKDALALDDLLQELLDRTGYEATCLAQPMGKRMLGNVRMILHRARSAGGERLGVADFVARLEDLVVRGVRHEQAAVAGEQDNVVRIMTVHKAKGLEFPVVILPELHIQPQSHTPDLSMEPGRPLVYGPRSDDGQRPAVHTAADRLGRQQRRAELLRTYYVAATRHEDHLVLVGANKRSRDGRFPSGSLLAETDEALDLTGTMEAGADYLVYRDQADRPCQLILRSIAPKPASRSKRAEPPGRALLAGADGPDQLAEAMLSQPAGDPPLLVGPLPAEPDSIELAVTALVDFQQCPMLYRWRYELRAPGWTALAKPEPPGGDALSDRPAGLDAATLGTLYHRCMELLDLDRPEPAQRLAARAAEGLPELTDLGPDALDALAGQFQPMLDDFLAGELADRLRSARRICRELDFVMALDSGTIRGQIDLIFLDADGQWHIVDYKSDRVDVRTAAQRADHYRLQMGLYALAAGRHLDTPPASACLYFLRPATRVDVPVDAPALAGAGEEVDRLVHKLAQARRTGRFEPADRPHCSRCPYAGLCPSADTP